MILCLLRTLVSVAFLAALLSVGACAHTSDAQDRPEDGEGIALDLAQVLVENGSHGSALPLVRRGLEARPNDARLHRLMGIILRDKGLLAEGEAELLLALELQPRSFQTFMALGILYDLKGQPETAEEYHRKAIEANPQSAKAHNNLGYSLLLQGRAEEARDSLRHSLRLDPSSSKVYNNLGFAQARCGDFKAALDSFQRAGGRAAALVNLGVAHQLAGNLEQARRSYIDALSLDSELEEARDNLTLLVQPPPAENESRDDVPLTVGPQQFQAGGRMDAGRDPKAKEESQ